MVRNERFYFLVSALAGCLWGLTFRGRKLRGRGRADQKPASDGATLRVLVIRLDELGDIVTTLPMLKAIRLHNPKVVLDLWCKPVHAEWLAPQLLVDTFWTSPGPRPVPDSPGNPGYDWILECRGNWQSLRYAMRNLSGGRRDRGSIRLGQRLKGKPQLHEWDINLRIAAPLLNTTALYHNNVWNYEGLAPILHDRDPSAVAEINLFKQRLDLDKYVVFHAGARKLLRKWSLQSWADLARQLHGDYGFEIVFVGTPEEVGDVERIRNMLDFEVFTYMEGRSIRYLIPLLAQASLMVGNESGPMHLASATGCPTIGLFGPGEPGIFSPKSAKFRALHVKLPCNPCGQVHCIHPNNPCMNRIAVRDVMDSVRELL
jgi:ADP-heptose:LPS heptosyltransferase